MAETRERGGVERHLPVEPVGVEGHERSARAERGVVDHEVDRIAIVDDPGFDRRETLRGRQVGAEHLDVAEAFRERLESVDPPSDRDHWDTGGPQHLDECFADAGRGAGDERPLEVLAVGTVSAQRFRNRRTRRPR